jgi:predicted RNA-binding Zn ribbon-like protein
VEAALQRDGFYFLGNHPALDFLNTRLDDRGVPIELLADSQAVARWLAAAGVIRETETLTRPWNGKPTQILQFREHLRRSVIRFEDGSPPSASFIHEINAHLANFPAIRELAASSPHSRVPRWHFTNHVESALGPMAEFAADLFATTTDPSRLRKCDACMIHFLDTSKKGTRRWCSMALCGNRAKVAAYTGRQKAL